MHHSQALLPSMYLLILIDVDYAGARPLTFVIGSIQLSFRTYHCVHPLHANMFSIQMLLHFRQIAPRVCTFVLFHFFGIDH